MKAFKKMALFFRPEPPRGGYEIGEFIGNTIEISTLSSSSIGTVCSFTEFNLVFISSVIPGSISIFDFLFQDEFAQSLFPSGGTNLNPRYYLVRINNSSTQYVAGLAWNQIISLQPCGFFISVVKFNVRNLSAGWIINDATPLFYIQGGSPFPLSNTQTMSGETDAFTNVSLSVNIQNVSGVASQLVLYKNGISQSVIPVTLTGIYTFGPISAITGDTILIELEIAA